MTSSSSVARYQNFLNSLGLSSDELSELAKKYGECYDVFLSFNGDDTRKTFTDHLYYQLKAYGFSVFKDDVSLPCGKEIADSLPKAMMRSRIAMPILSKNYVASRWCMNELLTMLELRKTMNLTVIPVFYDVTPSQVRHQTGTYAKAFENHSKIFDVETIYAWKKALAEVASLKGLELATATGGKEGEFTKMIVSKISNEIYKAEPDSKSVRFEKNMKKIETTLALGEITLNLFCDAVGNGMCEVIDELEEDFEDIFN